MATAEKKAWVRYDDGKESGEEKYELLLWEGGEWVTRMAATFVADANHPDAGKNFVSYQLVTEICNLSRHGYTIDI